MHQPIVVVVGVALFAGVPAVARQDSHPVLAVVDAPVAAAGNFGWGVDGVPDVDGDGRGDLLVGAPREDHLAQYDDGRAYVVSGASGALLYALESSVPQTAGYFGYRVAGVPDFDGDGRGDVAVGAYSEDGALARSGHVYLFSGASGALWRVLESPQPEVVGLFGLAVTGVADMTGDGAGDVLVGAPSEGVPQDAGRAYLISGATGSAALTLTAPVPEYQGNFGCDVAAVPDTDGDGALDVIVGARGEGVFPVLGSGRAYLFSGTTGALLRAFETPNPTLFGFFGTAVAGLDDVDGDGRGDVAIGAPSESGGRVYFFSGASGAPLGVVPVPPPQNGAGFGRNLAALDDVTGDGFGDLLVGAAGQGLGAAYVISGATRAIVADLRSPAPSGGGEFGSDVAAVQDVDGDGFVDFLVGADSEAGSAGADGRAYALSGVAAEIVALTPVAIGATAVLDVSSPANAGAPYLCGFSSGTTPGIPLGAGTVLPLNPDALFSLSFQPGSPFFQGTIGALDAAGHAPVQVAIPALPGLVGLVFHGAFVALDAASPTGVGTISSPLTLVVE